MGAALGVAGATASQACAGSGTHVLAPMLPAGTGSMGAHLHAHQRRRVRHGRDGGGGARGPVPAAASDVAPRAAACATRTTGVRRVGARTGAAVRAAMGQGGLPL